MLAGMRMPLGMFDATLTSGYSHVAVKMVSLSRSLIRFLPSAVKAGTALRPYHH